MPDIYSCWSYHAVDVSDNGNDAPTHVTWCFSNGRQAIVNRPNIGSVFLSALRPCNATNWPMHKRNFGTHISLCITMKDRPCLVHPPRVLFLTRQVRSFCGCYAKGTLWFKSDLYDLFYGRCSRRDATSVEEIRFLGIACDSMDFGGKTWTRQDTSYCVE